MSLKAVNKEIRRGPILNQQALWRASDNSSFFAFGGQPSRSRVQRDTGALNIPNTLWQFKPDGSGGGSWSAVSTAQNSNFSALVRPAGGLAAYGAGRGFYLGGFEGDVNVLCAPIQCSWPTIPGLLTYDIGANAWSNSSLSLPAHGAINGGGMQYVPIFGSRGVLLALGGKTQSSNVAPDGPSQSLNNVEVYDVASSTWYTQGTTGSTSDAVPSPRSNFCIVGAQSNNGTYEMCEVPPLTRSCTGL